MTAGLNPSPDREGGVAPQIQKDIMEPITGGPNAREGIKSTKEISKSEEPRFHGAADRQGVRCLILGFAQSL